MGNTSTHRHADNAATTYDDLKPVRSMSSSLIVRVATPNGDGAANTQVYEPYIPAALPWRPSPHAPARPSPLPPIENDHQEDNSRYNTRFSSSSFRLYAILAKHRGEHGAKHHLRNWQTGQTSSGSHRGGEHATPPRPPRAPRRHLGAEAEAGKVAHLRMLRDIISQVLAHPGVELRANLNSPTDATSSRWHLHGS